MAKKFNVVCTLIYNGNVEIEANTAEEALRKARTNFGRNVDTNILCSLYSGDVQFEFGEMTADYAEEDCSETKNAPLVHIVVSDICWDTGDVFLDQLDDDERPDLPDTVIITVPDSFDEARIGEDVIEPYLEANYGFCVDCFTYEIKRN